MADRLEHAAYLPVPALVDRQLDPAGRKAAHRRRCGRAVLELDAVREPGEVALVEVAVDGRDVRLLDAVARVRERVRERAVVREEEGAGRVDVEASDRDDARVVRDDVDDGAPPLRVARGRDVADRLVEQQVREPLRRDLDAVDLDPVASSRRRCSAVRAPR